MTDNNLLWYKNAVFYEVYLRAFFDSNADGHGDIPGLVQFDYKIQTTLPRQSYA